MTQYFYFDFIVNLHESGYYKLRVIGTDRDKAEKMAKRYILRNLFHENPTIVSVNQIEPIPGVITCKQVNPENDKKFIL